MIGAGGRPSRRATTFREITANGREARNCQRYSVRNGVRDDDIDIWAIRRGPELVAVASVFRKRMIMELRGPGNSSRFPGKGNRLVTWIAASGFRIDRGVDIAIADLLGDVPDPPDPMGDEIEKAARVHRIPIDIFAEFDDFC